MKHNAQDFFKIVCHRAWITNKKKKQTEQRFFWLTIMWKKFNACTSKEIVYQKDNTHHCHLSPSQW